MPLVRGGRPLKRWRYVGIFGGRLMLCAGHVQVGPARQTFWALWDREAQRLLERTAWLRHRQVALEPGRLRIRARGLEVDVKLEEGEGIETVCPHDGSYVWTRKQGGVAARGHVVIEGRSIELEALGIIDDTAGYHARETDWHWSAGVGTGTGGERLAWNLVEGVNDPPANSERSLWVDGRARELGPVTFDPALTGIRFNSGEELGFTSEAVRARNDNLLVLRSDYRQPFGTFEGSFPAGIELARGLGVMERHRALW